MLEEIKYLKSLRTDKELRKINRELMEEVENRKLKHGTEVNQATIDRLMNSIKKASLGETIKTQDWPYCIYKQVYNDLERTLYF